MSLDSKDIFEIALEVSEGERLDVAAAYRAFRGSGSSN